MENEKKRNEAKTDARTAPIDALSAATIGSALYALTVLGDFGAVLATAALSAAAARLYFAGRRGK
jgi:hypothetical protein